MRIRIDNPAKSYGVATLILPLIIVSWRFLFVSEVKKNNNRRYLQNGHPYVLIADGSHGEL
jgi:hypothetical protein